MPRLLLPIMLALALGAASPAAAQSTKQELIHQLLALLPLEETIEAMKQGMSQQMRAELNARYPGKTEMTNAFVKALDEVFEAEMGDLLPEIVAFTAREYERVFTEEDVRNMLAFYDSDTGRKALKEMPAMMQRSGQMTQHLLFQRMPRIQEGLRKRMLAAGYRLE